MIKFNVPAELDLKKTREQNFQSLESVVESSPPIDTLAMIKIKITNTARPIPTHNIALFVSVKPAYQPWMDIAFDDVVVVVVVLVLVVVVLGGDVAGGVVGGASVGGGVVGGMFGFEVLLG